MNSHIVFLLVLLVPLFCPHARAHADESDEQLFEGELKDDKVGLKTDDDVIDREARSIAPSEGYSEEELKLLEQGATKHAFSADVDKLMQLIIGALYSNKEIFLRELISNSSDALDKIRLQSLHNKEVLGEVPQLEIRIKADPEAGTVTITDTGVGMTKDELIKNLGTIAKSGTKEFAEALSKGADGNNLIGQFGVGFYSAFLVAHTVVVTSKHNDDPHQWVWRSDAKGEYSVSEDPKGNTLKRGTRIVLYMNTEGEDGADNVTYLQQDTLKALVQKYSEFITFPIYLWSSHEETKEVPVEEEAKDEDADTEEIKLDENTEEEEEEEKAPKTRSVTETVWDWARVNETLPIWTRSKESITDEEYVNFYKAITKDTQEPMTHIHFVAEGDVEFKSILYLPSEPPFGQFDATQKQRGVKLYVRRVFITDDFDAVIPKYLGFLKGVVDSDQLPLNISREILQQNKLLDLIKKKLVRKAIAMFQILADDEEKYNKFWGNYGTNIKLGVIEDSKNRTRLSKLLKFTSSKTEKLTTFDEYVSRMKPSQENIYYLAGESLEAVKKSPLLERLVKKGYEVLFMLDPIDEYTMQNLTKYDSKYTLTNVAKEGLKFDDDKDDDKDYDEEYKELSQYFTQAYPTKIGRVKVTNRLVRSPCALVAESWGYTATMERVIKAQALADQKAAKHWIGKKVLEINPTHPIIVELNNIIRTDKDDPRGKSIADLLLDAAALTSGYSVEDPAQFAHNIHSILSAKLGVEELVEEEEAPAEETVEADARKSSDDDEDDNKDEL